jgi:integrase/recombinase XerD
MKEIPLPETVRQFIGIDLFERNRFDGRELNPPKINAGKYWSRKTRRENFRLFLEGFYIKPTAPYAMRRVPTKKSKKTGRSLYAFMRFLADEGVMSPELLKRKIHIKLPIKLPKSIEPDDEDRILAKIDKVRDKALILLLLRTGMRIGELLKTTMQDISLEEQLIRIYESEKTGTGRVVYFSNDAAEALYQWLMKRDYWKKYLFHGPRDKAISYEAARTIFKKYVDKAGLSHKGITLHCLRHTYATRLLNAGMHIEVLRDLLGHCNLEQTRRYANLTDKTRKSEYFKAMAIIEGRKNK